MLFTLYFNLDTFSAAAEYFSISKSHLDKEKRVTEQLQGISPQSDLQYTKERQNKNELSINSVRWCHMQL